MTHRRPSGAKCAAPVGAQRPKHFNWAPVIRRGHWRPSWRATPEAEHMRRALECVCVCESNVITPGALVEVRIFVSPADHDNQHRDF